MRRFIADTLSKVEINEESLLYLNSIRDHYIAFGERDKRNRNALIELGYPLINADTGETEESVILTAPHMKFFEGDMWLVGTNQDAVNLDSLIRQAA